jgi:microcystin-dependent protein
MEATIAFSDWSTVDADNNTTSGINIAEGCPAANVNNWGRRIMSQLRSAFNPALDAFFASSSLAAARSALGVTGGSTSLNNLANLTNTANKIPYMTGADGWALTDMFPVGGIIPVASASAPAGFLECDGAAVSRTTYANLFGIVGTTYGAGDGSTTFNVPDLRGEFIRGWDHGKGTDSGRALGSAQSEAVGSHDHTLNLFATTQIAHDGSAEGDRTVQAAGTPTAGFIGSSGGAETRPRNIALLYAVKY